MKTRKIFVFILINIALLNWGLIAQTKVEPNIKICILPDKSDWIYKIGESVNYEVSILKDNVMLNDVNVECQFLGENLKPFKLEKIRIINRKIKIDGGTLSNPGFLRCRFIVKYDSIEFKQIVTVAFEPEKIEPTTLMPTDFIKFWSDSKNELSKIQMDSKIILWNERCTSKVNTYKVSLQNYPGKSRIFGVLCVPKAEGKYPAVLKVPGAGVRPYKGDVENAEKGIITFEIGVHGVPIDLPWDFYGNLMEGSLKNYFFFNLDDKDEYYYKRIYLGCIRSVDFIYSLPQFDGKNMFVQGGSQGGALSIVTAALDNRVKGLAVFYPALCDLTGYLHGKAGGWPHMFDIPKYCTMEKINTSYYYDVVNFAKLIKVPSFYSFGFNDTTCPPNSMYAAYNVLTAAKTLLIEKEKGHVASSQQLDSAWNWILNQIK